MICLNIQGVHDPIITSDLIKALVKGEMTLKVLDAPVFS